MKNIRIILLGLLCISVAVQSAPKAGHYSAVNGKSDKELFDALHKVTKQGYKSLSYKGLFTAYKTTDVNANGKIWDMYSDCTFEPDGKGYGKQCGNYKNECDCYNREHSIPQSWFGGTTSNNTPGTDIFHVVPTDGKINSARSNFAFGETSNGEEHGLNKLGQSSFEGYSGTVWEPADEYKGDFARGYFGTLLRWAGDFQAFTAEASGRAMFSGDYTADGLFGLTEYSVNLLMKWHREDPVSDKELKRNDGIEMTQGNRNPFIDYPELAEYLWGDHIGEAFPLSRILSAYGHIDNSIEYMYGVDALRVEGNVLMLQLPTAEQIWVYDYMGKLMYSVVSSSTEVQLPMGMYIVRVGTQTEKIVVR